MAATRDRADAQAARVLAVVDWSVDARAVADALRARSESGPVWFALLVPSRLPGLDWIGDPHAARPCAERQLIALWRLAARERIPIVKARIGDPERVAGIAGFLEDWQADRVLLFERGSSPGGPLSVASRVARKTGRRVERIAVEPGPERTSSRLRPARWRRAPRCAPAGA